MNFSRAVDDANHFVDHGHHRLLASSPPGVSLVEALRAREDSSRSREGRIAQCRIVMCVVSEFTTFNNVHMNKIRN